MTTGEPAWKRWTWTRCCEDGPRSPWSTSWEDVLDILGAGIDVITTVNIQHLESLADEVEQMTGTPVRERVPDWVVRTANQIELIDSSPGQLRRRMLHGNIYDKDKAAQALSHFFRTDNLIALRELALRFVADESDEELLRHLRRHKHQGPWETAERIMVPVTTAPGADALLRRAARIASRYKAELEVVHVVADDTGLSGDSPPVDGLRELAADLGARWHDIQQDDPARAIVGFARQHEITQILIGLMHHSWWHPSVGGPIARHIIEEAEASGIDVLIVAPRALLPVQAPDQG